MEIEQNVAKNSTVTYIQQHCHQQLYTMGSASVSTSRRLAVTGKTAPEYIKLYNKNTAAHCSAGSMQTVGEINMGNCRGKLGGGANCTVQQECPG